jgi:hypothetical protein
MIRTPLNLSYIKRELRPLYGWSQATPKAAFVDPSWTSSVDIYPGMVMQKMLGDNVTLLNASGTPYGLASFLMAPKLGIDEITETGVNACAVWVMGPDAEFEILAPSFDTTATWTDPGNGTTALVYAYTTGAYQGVLCPSTGSQGSVSALPVARLLQVASTSKIRIGGLQARTA